MSIPWVGSRTLCVHVRVIGSACAARSGCPIQTSPDQRLFANSPELIAGCRVFLRLWTPRHPPCTLNDLDHINEKLSQPARRRLGQPSTDVESHSRYRRSSLPLCAGWRLELAMVVIHHTQTYSIVKERSTAAGRSNRSAIRSTLRPSPPACSPQALKHPSGAPELAAPRPFLPSGADRARTGNP